MGSSHPTYGARSWGWVLTFPAPACLCAVSYHWAGLHCRPGRLRALPPRCHARGSKDTAAQVRGTSQPPVTHSFSILLANLPANSIRNHSNTVLLTCPTLLRRSYACLGPLARGPPSSQAQCPPLGSKGRPQRHREPPLLKVMLQGHSDEGRSAPPTTRNMSIVG